ncbi:MAG: DMT family transporter [Chloroflexi bacterium]|nr:DMT family transporter [Chloroflexota bacterium]
MAESSEAAVVRNLKPFLALFFGLMAVSTAAIFIRLAQAADTPSLVVATGRLVVACVILTPLAVRNYLPELRRLRPIDLGLALLSGGVLGMHFASWISSLEYTSVVNSVVLVTTNPLWVALLAPLFLSEKISQWTLIGLALAFAGGVLVAISGETGSPPTRADPALGNGLALFGALMAALYFIVGRQLRGHLSVIPYIWLVYTTAALLLFTVSLVSGELQHVPHLPAEAFWWILLLGLVPQLVGHSAFNYALGFLPAAYVSLVVLGEPVGSGLLAALFLDEWPGVLQLLGALLILCGIGLSTRDQFRKRNRAND